MLVCNVIVGGGEGLKLLNVEWLVVLPTRRFLVVEFVCFFCYSLGIFSLGCDGDVLFGCQREGLVVLPPGSFIFVATGRFNCVANGKV